MRRRRLYRFNSCKDFCADRHKSNPSVLRAIRLNPLSIKPRTAEVLIVNIPRGFLAALETAVRHHLNHAT